MNQFFFGNVEKPLYAVHQEPHGSQLRDSAVLICYPTGREYMRCHRALVKLCDRLAEAGFHSLRFDYFGTGDSAGEYGDGDLTEWVSNAQLAAEELREISGVQKISVLGVRLGAAVAFGLLQSEAHLKAAVLWDPVTDGEQFLRRLTKMHMDFVEDTNRFPALGTQTRNVSGDEYLGMVYSPELKASISNYKVSELSSAAKDTRLSLVVSEDSDDYQEAYAALKVHAPACTYHPMNEPSGWDSLSDLGVVLMPHGIMKRIVSVLEDADS